MKTIFVKSKDLDGNKISYQYIIAKLEFEKNLGSNIKKLKEISVSITDGTRIIKEYVERNGNRIIGPGDIKDNNIYINNLKVISKNELSEKDYIKEGDILITTSGKSGQIIYVLQELEGSVITCDICRLRFGDESYALGIYNFLKSELGQLQLQSIMEGKLNRISLKDIGNLLIPKDINITGDCTKKSLDFQDKQNKIYRVCVNQFKKIVDYDPIDDKLKGIFYTEERLLDSKRLDVKFYAYKEGILQSLISEDTKEIKWQNLGELVEIKRAIKPPISEDQEVKYFTLKNIDAGLSVITTTENGVYGQLSNRMRYIVKEGEVVTAKAGSATGKEGHISAVITKSTEGMLTTDAFFNLIPRKINPYYLLFLLKQPVILRQIEMNTKGELYKVIQRDDFENIRIPRLNSDIEDSIIKKMKEYIEGYEEALLILRVEAK
ncbi:MAG: restriction endonuclease subunit S [Clostridium sp.]